ELSDRMKALYGDDRLQGFLHFDAKVLRDIILSLLNPDGPWAAFISLDSDMAEGVPSFLEGLKGALEFRSLDILASDMERADFTIVTEAAKQEDIDAISAMAAKWSAMEAEEQKKP
ncbi:MAG: hypothetical protein PWP47_1664, partial [Synergistaceae bacterium]|nr:hypothetical protein [Synergistaceae bacterium]